MRLEVVEKVAMLIGNADVVLKKPINDILLLAQKLTSVGFKVIPLINLGAEDMLKALEMFSNLLEEGVYGTNLKFLTSSEFSLRAVLSWLPGICVCCNA
jgi:hypothetical protein